MAEDRWADRLGRMDRAIDRTMSETVRFVPQRPGSDYSHGGADPARPAFECMALLTLGRTDVHTGGEQRHVFNTRLAGGAAELQVQRALVPAGTVFREGDLWQALARGVSYKISRVDDRHPGRWAFKLAEVADDGAIA